MPLFPLIKKIVFCVIFLGVAVLLFLRGKTSHIIFKIPIDINELSICYIQKQLILAELLKRITLIVWNKVLMQHKYYFATTNHTISNIKDNDKSLFGGISVRLGRDFAQTTLVVPGGSKVQQVNASIWKWFHWYKFKIIHLTENMRLLPAKNTRSGWQIFLTTLACMVPFLYYSRLGSVFIRQKISTIISSQTLRCSFRLLISSLTGLF